MQWLILIGISAAFGVYAVGGAAYSRSSEPNKGMSHPHADAWLKLPGLVSDGWRVSRVAASEKFGLSFLKPADGDRGGSDYKSLDKEIKRAGVKTERTGVSALQAIHVGLAIPLMTLRDGLRLQSDKKERKERNGEKKEKKEKKEKREKTRKPKPKPEGDALLSGP